MNTFDQILSRQEFIDAPPVLVHIGASGGVSLPWRAIRRHAVCLAFDGDENGLKSMPHAAAACKRLYVYNSLVSANGNGVAQFHLARSADCSSTLPPQH